MKNTSSLLLVLFGAAACSSGGAHGAADAQTLSGNADATRVLALETACGQYAAPILAGQYIDAGSAVVSNDGEFLYVALTTAPGWLFDELHVYAGFGPVPTNEAGTPVPGQFPYAARPEEPATEYTFAIALADFGLTAETCAQPLNVAVHAAMRQVDADSGETVAEETGWAFGDNEFDSNRWGWWFQYGFCCAEPEEGESCTLTQGYWKNHNALRTQPSQATEWPAPEDEGNLLCDKTWLDILHTPPRGGDAWIILAHQYIAAKLNVASGASTGAQLDEALADAEDMLTGNCQGLPTDTRADALYTAGVLDSYNNGDIGPGHCEDEGEVSEEPEEEEPVDAEEPPADGSDEPVDSEEPPADEQPSEEPPA